MEYEANYVIQRWCSLCDNLRGQRSGFAFLDELFLLATESNAFELHVFTIKASLCAIHPVASMSANLIHHIIPWMIHWNARHQSACGHAGQLRHLM